MERRFYISLAFGPVLLVLVMAILIATTLNASATTTGDGGNDRIHGTASDNRLSGGAGDDVVAGHKGDDTLFGGPGSDAINGGQGFDVCYVGGTDRRVLNCEDIR